MKKKIPITEKSIFIAAFIAILLIGSCLRFNGANWDQDFHLHPDERFLTMVETAIKPVNSVSEYFDTSKSSLNPHNVLDSNGDSVYPFFVYGTLPLFLVRYLAELTNRAGYNQVFLLGRYLSALFDIGTIVLVLFITQEIFSKRWLSLLSSFLYSCAVLPIQISHFFIVDNFTTFFAMLAFYAAIKIWRIPLSCNWEETDKPIPIKKLLDLRGTKYYALFAVAYGMALSSKINAGVIVVILPLAILISKYAVLKNASTSVKLQLIHHLFFSALLSFIVFRIFQPYAFSGPGFFDIIPNKKWINNIAELAALSSGKSNYPPSLQWARRSFYFPLKNLMVWGIGLPAGLFSLFGFILMGWKIIKGHLREYGMIWIFPVAFLIWQASQWNPTMRYFLLIYPFLMIASAWFLSESVEFIKKKINPEKLYIKKICISLLSILLIIGTFLWAFSFTNIYRKPMTRIAASEWIYDNVESAVNLEILDAKGLYSQPLPYSHILEMRPGGSISMEFFAKSSGVLNKISIDHIVSPVISETEQELLLQLIDERSNEIVYSEILSNSFKPSEDSLGTSYYFNLPDPYKVIEGDALLIVLSHINGDSGLNFSGYVSAIIEIDQLEYSQAIFQFGQIVRGDSNYQVNFRPFRDGSLTKINLFRVLNIGNNSNNGFISIEIIDSDSTDSLGIWTEKTKNFENADYRGKNLYIDIKQPLLLSASKSYILRINSTGAGARLSINGSKSAKETDWDDALPLYMHGLNPFDTYSGIYASDLNFQMYWDDNQEKLNRMIDILDRTDYIIFSSNRQWGSTTQIPERYPLTIKFYKELLGCNSSDVQSCYRKAEPEMFEGTLGFDLVKTFQVNPSFGVWEFNSQFAEEAFTVYDHPKVLVFRKAADFNINHVRKMLSSIDLGQVLNLTPEEAEKRPGTLMLDQEEIELQSQSGTWSKLFDYEALQNKIPVLSALIWYISIAIVGWMFYPLNRLVFKKLPDRGFPLLRIASLIFIALPIWFLSSIGLSFSRPLIITVIVCAGFVNFLIYFRNRETILDEIKQNLKYFLNVEFVNLLFFTSFLLVRLGNPDLWHPFKGGEKPMDFSYFNAVIKSIHFPPYDPWYSGGYINYYYYGFVLAAIPVKAIGIVPAVAYNLVLPTFFSYTALSAFSLGWNFQFEGKVKEVKEKSGKLKQIFGFANSPYFWAITSALFVLLIGNLGTVRMVFQGIFRLGINSLPEYSGNIIQIIRVFGSGLRQFFTGAKMPYYPGDWYWIPSRSIPGEPITEFPLFTFLYGDPHAHLFAYPVTLLALSWILSIVFGKFKYTGYFEAVVHIFAGAAIIGALRVINTWDFPAYLGLACLVIIYIGWKHIKPEKNILGDTNKKLKRLFISLAISAGLFILTLIFYSPFIKLFGQGYASIDIWKGNKTPLGSYLIHWGFFIFIIFSWMIVETYDWMATTRISSLKPYFRFRKLIGIAAFLFGIIFITGIVLDIQVLWVVFPAFFGLSVLFFGRSNSDLNRFMVLLLFAGFSLTLLVEVIVLKGDIGRMNTVFKFYLQAWTFLGLGAAWCFCQLIVRNRRNAFGFQARKVWSTIFFLLIISVSLFTITASIDKVKDRISNKTPITLDGMEFMNYSEYLESDSVMDLSHDYEAIHWMQENIMGTPVIVEANVPEYRWGNRFTMYTGLPGVLGWNWHQRQQRSINPPNWVTDRADDINEFYSSDDLETAKEFLKKYHVKYIVVGQLEKIVYPMEGINKFNDQLEGFLSVVYSADDTIIYEVN